MELSKILIKYYFQGSSYLRKRYLAKKIQVVPDNSFIFMKSMAWRY